LVYLVVRHLLAWLALLARDDVANRALIAALAGLFPMARRMRLSQRLPRHQRRRRFGRPNRVCTASADWRMSRVARFDPRRVSTASLSFRTPATA